MSKTKDVKKDIVLSWIKHDFLQLYLSAGIILGILLSGVIFMTATGLLNLTRCFLPQIKDEGALEEYVADAIIEKSEARFYPEEIWDTGVTANIIETTYVPNGPQTTKKSTDEERVMYFAILGDDVVIVLQEQSDFKRKGSLEELEYIRVDNERLNGTQDFIASIKAEAPALYQFDNVYVLNGYYQNDNRVLVILVSILAFVVISIFLMGFVLPRIPFFQKMTNTGKNIAALALREYIPWKDMCRQINECVKNQVLYQSGAQYITKYALFVYPGGRGDKGIMPVLLRDIAIAEVLKSDEPFECNTLRFYLDKGGICDFTVYLNDYEANQIVRYIQMEKERYKED